MFEDVAPRLSVPCEVIGGEVDVVRCERTLPAEEMLAAVDPVQGIHGAVLVCKVELAEAQYAQPILKGAA